MKIYFVAIAYMTAVLLNGLGCLWHAIARMEGYSNSWLVSVGSQGENLTNASSARQYVASIYFACTTVTTIGYGEVRPVARLHAPKFHVCTPCTSKQVPYPHGQLFSSIALLLLK